MLVSNGFRIWHVSLLWGMSVSDETFLIGSETQQSLTCLVGVRHAWFATDMPDQRPSCLIGDWHTWLETDMPDRRPTCQIGDLWPTWLMKHDAQWVKWGLSVSDEVCWSPMGFQYVSDNNNIFENNILWFSINSLMFINLVSFRPSPWDGRVGYLLFRVI